MRQPAPWFTAQIIKGIQTLIAMNLPFKPATEMITVTAKVWTKALWLQRSWSESDMPRLEEAFFRAGGYCAQFPAPKEIMIHLPAAKEVQKLETKRSPADIAAGKRELTKIFKQLGSKLNVK